MHMRGAKVRILLGRVLNCRARVWCEQARNLLAEMLKSRVEASELAARYNISILPKSTKVRFCLCVRACVCAHAYLRRVRACMHHVCSAER